MIISLDKFKNDGSGNGGSGKYVVTDGTRFGISTWETIPEELDFSQVTDFSAMFNQATNLKTGLYLDDWSKAVDCSAMYQMCSNLESVPDMNTSNCKGFMKTFQGTSIVNAPNIDVSNAIRVDFMFDSCPNLTRIGVLDTAHLTAPAAFAQLCSFCPKLTTIEGIDFSGLTAAPIVFYQNDSLTNITVNGSISFSWLQYGFGELPNLSEDSVISILSAMARCNNPEETKQMNIQYNYDYGTDISAINTVLEECRSKGWFIGGIQMKVPYVIIDSVSSEVEPGGYVEVAYSVTNDFDHFIALDKITLHIYDDYGYEKDFNIESASRTIFLRDSDLKDPFFRTYVVYGGQQYSGSEYSYTRLEQTEPEEPDSGEPEYNFWVEPNEVIAGETVTIRYEITNFDNIGFAPIMKIDNPNTGTTYIETTIKESEGYVDITDDPNYEPECYIGLLTPDYSELFYGTTLSWKRGTLERPSDVDTSVWGNPDEAIPVTMAEFIAAEPSTTQWYEIKGKILTAPQVETGKMIIQSIDGDTGQTVYYDEKGHENALFVNYCWNVALMNPNDVSMSNPWFPGDYQNIIIRTLKHSYDTNVYAIDGLGEDNNGTTIAGQYNGSPCAVYVGTYEGESEPEEPEGGEPKFSFWVETEEVNAGDTVRINYEITNYGSIGFAPIMLINNNDGSASYIEEPITINVGMGYVDITDNPDYEPQCIISLINPTPDEIFYQTTLYWNRLENEEPENPEQPNVPANGIYESDSAFVCTTDDDINQVSSLGETTINGEAVTGFKLGSGSGTGYFKSGVVSVSGDKYLNFYAVAWKGKSATLYMRVDGGETTSLELNAHVGATGTPPFTALTAEAQDHYSVKLTGLTETSTIEFSTDESFSVASTAYKGRAIVFGMKLADEPIEDEGGEEPTSEPEA